MRPRTPPETRVGSRAWKEYERDSMAVYMRALRLDSWLIHTKRVGAHTTRATEPKNYERREYMIRRVKENISEQIRLNNDESAFRAQLLAIELKSLEQELLDDLADEILK